jgi:hypothetical protein
MERKFLEDLGIEKETVDKIMTENGKDVEAQKTKTATAETSLATANTTIKDLQDTVKKFDGVDVEKLRGDLKDLQTKYDTDTAVIKLGNAVELALRDAKVKNPKPVKAMLDMSIVKMDGDNVLGLNEQLEKLRGSDGYLFEPADDGKGGDGGDGGAGGSGGQGGGAHLDSGGNHGSGGNPDYDKMTDVEYYKAMEANKKKG